MSNQSFVPRFLLVLAGLMVSNVALAQDCESFSDRIGITSGSDARVTLQANEAVADDKEAIVCAFEAAAENGISRVQLQAGDFYLSQIEIHDFVGSFEGRSIAATTLNTIPDIIDCVADRNTGKASAAIRFVAGQPRLRTMTINAAASCFDEQELQTVVHITGQPSSMGCENDITQAAVDRVVLQGPGIFAGVGSGIGVWAQGYTTGGCRDTLLGTFKLNRSEISGFEVGVITSMQGGAQVDVNFNRFTDMLEGYRMERSRQITSVTLNEFVGAPTINQTYDAIRAFTNLNAPDKTALTVSGNHFILDPSQTSAQVNGITTFGFSDSLSISLVVKENTFDMLGFGAQAVYLFNTSNSVIIDNRFAGVGDSVLLLRFNDGPSRDNAVLANQFDLENSFSDVDINPGVERTIVGPGQDAKVFDSGTDSILTDNTKVNALP